MKKLLALILLPVLLFAQQITVLFDNANGTLVRPTPSLFKSANGIGSGDGTVSTFSAGTLSPLFTTSVATATTTPALTFSLSNAAQNTVLAGPTSGTGAPTYRALVAGDLPAGALVSSITGTANQVIASSSTGAVTLSTPQDIATTSSPTFANPVVTSLSLGATTPGVISGSSGAITLTAAGTNQNVNLAPSGTGLLVAPNLYAAGSNDLTLGTQGGSASINLLPNSLGTVGVNVANNSNGPALAVKAPAATTSPNITASTWGAGVIAAYSEATNGINMNIAGSSTRGLNNFKVSDGTLAAPTAVSNSSRNIGEFLFSGYDGSSFREAASIWGIGDGTVGSGFVPGSLHFFTSNSAGTASTALKIRATGGSEFTPTQPVSVSTATGNAAGNLFTVQSPTGGQTTIATTGTGGSGGAVLFTGGGGGTAPNATTSSTGGGGGIWRVAGGGGGAAAVTGSGNGTGGVGSEIRIISGTGGAASTSTGTNTGGAGGVWTLTTGNGGAATGGSSNTGGAGGDINITTGNGGSGATATGNSGTLTLNTGTSGSGGTVGSIIFKTGGTTALTLNSSQNSTFAGNVQVPTTSLIGFNSSGGLRRISDGNFFFGNSNNNDVGLVGWGGSSSSFPALKRSTTTLAVRLADDSADAPISAAVFLGGVQALSGAGAVNVTQQNTDYTSTGGAQALTLANGTVGQTKTIVHVVDGGSGVLTPTTKIGFTSLTFTNVGDAVTLRYSSAGWAIVGINGTTITP